MEKDNIIKELLQKDNVNASPDFTNKVMLAVEAFANKPLVYEPLLPPIIKRIFIISFTSVLFLIGLVCISVAAPGADFIAMLPLPDISPATYQKIISCIIIFWLVFLINRLFYRFRWRLPAVQ